MGKVKVPWLVFRVNANGTRRFYFMPHWKDRGHGWAAIRLHDKNGQAIQDPLEAANACDACTDVYERWRKGEPGFGPRCIDRLGRVVDTLPKKNTRAAAPLRSYRPGQIGAMIRDFKSHEIFKSSLREKTQKEYSLYLALLEEKFGDRSWWLLSPGEARSWLRARGQEGGWSGAHACYRVCRAFMGKTRLIYNEVGHSGIVPDEKNPFSSLDLGLPKSPIILWPREAIDLFVKLADDSGQPSIGDAVVKMSWLGIRKQDWLDWPASVFDPDLLAFAQEKTGKPLVIPWKLVPPLVERVSEARRRREAASVTASTFFHDRHGRPWGKPARFRDAFNALRDELAKEHPHFDTRYYVGLDPNHPLRLPTLKLTMRTLRHTCVTLNHDAGVSRDLMPAITGHEPKMIDEVLAYYYARTADQAEAALSIRVAHEASRSKS